ncbi:MAG TPA: GntR family transcriptional regulator [Rhodospirillales bacterium]|nr:GntR family transcriptional regulator [Rhodospirillales bacterium]
MNRSGIALETIRSRIFSGNLRPGDNISIPNLAKELGISRQPLNEALKQLETMKIVEIIPQVGSTVITPKKDDVINFLYIFSAIEAAIFARVAEIAQPAELENLGELITDDYKKWTEAQTNEDKSEIYRRHNRNFHTGVHTAAGSSVMTDISYPLWDRMDFYITVAIGAHSFAPRLPDAFDEHREILAAMHSMDIDKVRQLTERHVQSFIKEIS